MNISAIPFILKLTPCKNNTLVVPCSKKANLCSNTEFQTAPVKYGVPQSSILGPISFLINVLPFHQIGNMDDVQLCLSFKNVLLTGRKRASTLNRSSSLAISSGLSFILCFWRAEWPKLNFIAIWMMWNVFYLLNRKMFLWYTWL